MSTTIIEAVARGLHADLMLNYPFDDLSAHLKGVLYRQTKAALYRQAKAALLAAAEAVSDDMVREMVIFRQHGQTVGGTVGSEIEAWRCMLSAALRKAAE